MAAVQPNVPVMVAAFNSLSTEFSKIPNVPALNPNIAVQMNLLQTSITNLTQTVDANNTNLTQAITDLTTMVTNMNTTLTNNITNLTNAVNRLEANLPMKLANAAADHDRPLRDVNLAPLAAPHPGTRDELLSFTVAQCTASANAFGLQALPNNATVVQRRQQIAAYLGVWV